MFDRLKTSLAVLLGLAIGLVAAMPLLWWGSRKGAEALWQNISKAAKVVETRQQAMADEALNFEFTLKGWDYTQDKDIFSAMQTERSRLAGAADLEGKVRQLLKLEQLLLLSEKVWIQAGEKPKILQRHEYGRYGRDWEKNKRYLVREQMQLEDSVAEYNQLLSRWPASIALRYGSLKGMIKGFFGEVVDNVKYLVRLSLDWVGYAFRRMAALRGQEKPPEAPRWHRPQAKPDSALLALEVRVKTFPRPVFLAEAPKPEDDYDELQYGNAPLNVADVEVGEEPAVLERRHAPAPFAAPVPTKQLTVTYR